MFKIKKLILKTVAVPLASAIVFSTAVLAAESEPSSPAPEQQTTEQDNFIVSDVSGGAVSLSSETISPEDYAVIGVSENAIAAKGLTVEYEANFEPQFDWSVSWAEGGAEEWTVQEVTDFVTVIPTQDGASNALAECFQPFGAQIVITATVRQLPDVSAEIPIDYCKRLSDECIMRAAPIYLSENEEDEEEPTFGTISLGQQTSFGIAAEKETLFANSNGTVNPTITATAVLTLSSNFIYALTSYGSVASDSMIIRSVNLDLSVQDSGAHYELNYYRTTVADDFYTQFFTAGYYNKSGYDKATAVKRAVGYIGRYTMAELAVTFSGEYGGKTYWTKTVSVEFKFDATVL